MVVLLRSLASQQRFYFSTVSREGVVNIDRLRLFLSAGHGGLGLKRFNGVGGDGGDVILIPDPKMSLETMVKNVKGTIVNVKAGNGMNASHTCLVASRGRSKILRVPLGVDVINTETKLLVARCSRPFFNYVVARGGQGACAENCFQASSGDRFLADLHLKLHANIGLVGFPNAGKSTLMKALIPKKCVKIACYPFTTLKPQIGHVTNFENESESSNLNEDRFSLSLADFPGLIEGAAANRGRGRHFLKHLENSDILLLVVDVFGFKLDLSFSNAYRSALETIALLNIELEKYDTSLVTKPAIVALNKIDLPGGEENAEELVRILQRKDWSTLVSAEIRPQRPLSLRTAIPIAAKDCRLGSLKKELKEIYERMNPLTDCGEMSFKKKFVLA
ncbi:unnamed protein product [Thelazia callipaeda]|uniref:OBG-type G domain-containing protein n=1 Tax=Thelazia callipaeda TaxID=103827 RepID=A0A0N5D3K0_THECL|nr:unnamed protein product [Thelazia callipaeda]